MNLLATLVVFAAVIYLQGFRVEVSSSVCKATEVGAESPEHAKTLHG